MGRAPARGPGRRPALCAAWDAEVTLWRPQSARVEAKGAAAGGLGPPGRAGVVGSLPPLKEAVLAARLEVTREQVLAFRRRVGGLDARLPRGRRSLREAARAGLKDSPSLTLPVVGGMLLRP